MYELYEDAASLTVFLYGLMVALGVAGYWIMLSWNVRRSSLPKGADVLTVFLSIPLGLCLARLLFCLADNTYRIIARPADYLMLTDGGYAMFGALGGAVLAAILAAKLLRAKPAQLLDAAAPAILIFVCLARLGEGFVSGLGISRSLIYHVFQGTFLAQVDEYDAYLRTWILEAICAAVLCLVVLYILAHEERDGYTFLKGCMLFGATQVFFESLRYDQHLMYSFVGVQHILAMVTLGVPVIVLALRAVKQRRALSLAALISIPVVVGAIVFIEFRIDRTGDNRFILYAIYDALLAIPTVLGFQLSKEDRA